LSAAGHAGSTFCFERRIRRMLSSTVPSARSTPIPFPTDPGLLGFAMSFSRGEFQMPPLNFQKMRTNSTIDSGSFGVRHCSRCKTRSDH
jgi:hypothetical protein